MKIHWITRYHVGSPRREGSYHGLGERRGRLCERPPVRIETDTGLMGDGDVCALGAKQLGVSLGHAEQPFGLRAQGYFDRVEADHARERRRIFQCEHRAAKRQRNGGFGYARDVRLWLLADVPRRPAVSPLCPQERT